MYVRDFMTTAVVTAGPLAPLSEALRRMDRVGVNRLPVCDGRQLVGIVTRHDIERAVAEFGPGKRALLSVMKWNPATVRPDETLERAVLTMMDQKISGLPVVKGGELVGLLTKSDVFVALAGLFGFDGEGTRISMEFGDGTGLLENLQRRVGHLKVQSLVTHHDRATRTWRVVARVRGRSAPLKNQHADLEGPHGSACGPGGPHPLAVGSDLVASHGTSVATGRDEECEETE